MYVLQNATIYMLNVSCFHPESWVVFRANEDLYNKITFPTTSFSEESISNFFSSPNENYALRAIDILFFRFFPSLSSKFLPNGRSTNSYFRVTLAGGWQTPFQRTSFIFIFLLHGHELTAT